MSDQKIEATTKKIAASAKKAGKTVAQKAEAVAETITETVAPGATKNLSALQKILIAGGVIFAASLVAYHVFGIGKRDEHERS